MIAGAIVLAAAVPAAIVGATQGGARTRQPTAGARTALGRTAGTTAAPTRSAAGPARGAGTPDPRGRPVVVRIQPARGGAQVPGDFLGISFEASALARIAAPASRPQLEGLLGSLGRGFLRFGGRSVDRWIAWSENGSAPPWAHGTISPGDLSGLAALTSRTGWRVLLTVNLGHYDPAAAAQEALAARSQLGASLAGIEIGNEPDRLARDGLRGPGWSFSRYAHEFALYRKAIEQAAPGLPLVAPDASSGEPPLPWVTASAALHPVLLTDHYYPLTSCGTTPTVGELMSPLVRFQESSMLTRVAAIGGASGTPLSLDETNNISCMGEPGVSDSFASALWATDYIARAMDAGLRNLDFHDLLGRPGAYSPLVERRGGLHANPEWYALLLAHSLDGSRAIAADVRAGSELSVHAFSLPGGAVELALVNFERAGPSPLRVSLRIPGAFTAGTILRLRAPSPYATSHVTLGGAEVAPSGSWRPAAPLPRVYDGRSGLALAMPAASAALVTLEPR